MQHFLVVVISLAYHTLQPIQPTHIYTHAPSMYPSLFEFRSFSDIYPFFFPFVVYYHHLLNFYQ